MIPDAPLHLYSKHDGLFLFLFFLMVWPPASRHCATEIPSHCIYMYSSSADAFIQSDEERLCCATFQIMWKPCHFFKGSVEQVLQKAIFFLQIQIEMWLSISPFLYSWSTFICINAESFKERIEMYLRTDCSLTPELHPEWGSAIKALGYWLEDHKFKP